MPDVPIRTDLGRQFPALVVVLLLVWHAFKYIREQHTAHSASTNARADAQIREMKESHQQQVEQLKSWNEDLRNERDRLNRELAKRRK